jgi:type I restriction enzyme, S subunit
MADILLKRAIKIIPDDWERVKIGDIGTTFGGLTNKSKKDFGEGKPFIPFMNIMNNAKIDMDDFDYVNIEEDENQNRAIKGDLFFNTSSETPEEVGMCSVLDNDISELYLNSFCFGYRLKDQDSLNPLFVSYLFRSDFGRKVIFPLAQGMTRYNLSKRYFLELEIPKPTLEEQNTIIEILSKVDETIEKTDSIIEETRQLKKGLIQKLFTEGIGHTRFKETKIGRIPEEWDVLRLQEMMDKKTIVSHLDGNHGSLYPKAEEFASEGIPYLVANCILEGRVDFTKAKYLTIEKVNKLRKGFAKNKDVLFAHNATVGPTAVLITNLDTVILSTSLTYYRCDEEKLNPYYLSYYMSSFKFKKQYESVMKQTTRNQVPITAQRKFFHILPYIKEQNKIAQILYKVDAKIEKEEATKAELEQLKKGLMQVLLSGKVRVKA